MKKVFSALYLVAIFAAVFFVSHLYGAHVAALAGFVPLMPSLMGRRMLNRAIVLADGTWGMGGETLHYPVYDRLRMLNSIVAGVARSLFKTAVGQQREGVTLNFDDTNIEKSESVPSSQKWTFWKLTVQYLAVGARTDVQILNILDYFRTTTFRCIINSKDDMFRLPLWKFLGSPQMITAPAVTVNSRFPQAIFSGAWDMKVPIILQSLTDWSISVEPRVASAAALDNDFIGFEFDGQRDRKD